MDRTSPFKRSSVGATMASAMVLLSACGHLVPANNQTIDPASLPDGQFEIDKAHANILWKVNHLGFSTYVGRFNDFDAQLDFDPENPEASKLRVTIETGSVDTGDPDFDAELRGSTWFNSDAYPQAIFVSDKIGVDGESAGTVSGVLELKGVQQPVTLDVTFNGGANNLLTGRYTLGFAASTTVSRSAFDMGLLVPAIGDEVTLEINAEFIDVGN